MKQEIEELLGQFKPQALPSFMDIKFIKAHPKAQLPTMANKGDAGFDLFAVEPMVLFPGQTCSIPLGLKSSFVPQFVAMILGRSSLTAIGVEVLGDTINSNDREEWHVLMKNGTEQNFSISPGARVAQVIFFPKFTPTMNWVDSL